MSHTLTDVFYTLGEKIVWSVRSQASLSRNMSHSIQHRRASEARYRVKKELSGSLFPAYFFFATKDEGDFQRNIWRYIPVDRTLHKH
jgi:hypothetical protein